MLPRRREAESDEAPGAPEWMVTFSDCMTLLLTFFVLLLSFSSFDEHVFRKLKVIFCKALPAPSPPTEKDKDAFLTPPDQVVPTEDLDEGSEKPTLARGWEDNRANETGPEDFRSRKVFLIPSKEIFWGKGAVISKRGRDSLATMASFLREVPSRVVISENGKAEQEGGRQLGLPRAWVVLDFLTSEQGLDKGQFSIAAASTLTQEGSDSDEPNSRSPDAERMLEIVLLERRIYD
jgi:chemotaxis protein MotB